MLIIGCDYHPGFQQIAFVNTETGELGERRLSHREARPFYRVEATRVKRASGDGSQRARTLVRAFAA